LRQVAREPPVGEPSRTLQSFGRVAADYPDTRLVMPIMREHIDRLEPAQRGS
jgi:hypothetical protein